MAYSIEIGDGMGSIFQRDDQIYLCDGLLTVRVKSEVYHERMHRWIEDRMQTPLVFVDGVVRCTMRAQDGCGDVLIELAA